MDSKVVDSHVQDVNDEQNSQNIEPYPVTLTHGPEEPSEPEKKSVMSRVKAKARKVRDSIKKQGQKVLDPGNGNSNEIQHTPESDDEGDLDEEDKEVVQDPQVHQVPSEKPYNPLVGGASLTTAINQKNATDKAAEEKQEQSEANLERSIVLEEEDSRGKQISRPEAYTLPNYQTKDTDPSGEVYDNEDVKIATPTPEYEKVENLGNSGIDIEGTKVKGEEPYHDTQVEDDSSTTEINQNIANDQAKTFPGEEKPEQYKINLDNPVIVSEEYPVKQGTRTEEYTLPNYQINHTAPSDAENDELNVHDDEQKPTTDTKTQPSVADTEYPPAAGSHDRSVPHFSDATTTENEYPKETGSTHIIRNDDILEEDSQDQGTTKEYTLPNYQTKDTDGSGPESNKLKDITPPLEESLERLNVHDDEPKPFTEQKIQPSAAADIEYPPAAAAGSHDKFVSHLSDVTETQNEHPQETVSTDINRNHEIPSETEETFNTITNTVENQPDYEESVETQPKHKSYIDETEISSATTADKTLLPESDGAYNLGNDGTSIGSNDGTETKNGDKGATVNHYKALAEVISEDLHKGKEEPSEKEDGKLDTEVEKPEKVLFEESNVDSPGKGMVGRVKDYYGSWFAKPEENQSPQGAGISTEDLSKTKDSVAEVKQVDKVVD
ncbi:hypothetical protein P8452_04783 [Trifolium repens]|nr:hypothetical protein P8452_04783 [Trifolium repens]